MSRDGQSRRLDYERGEGANGMPDDDIALKVAAQDDVHECRMCRNLVVVPGSLCGPCKAECYGEVES